MPTKIKKSLLVLLCSLTFTSSIQANYQNSLPNIGTSGSSTLTIPKEIEMGDFYTRKLRLSAAFIDDPVLLNYINNLGSKLVAVANYPSVPFDFFVVFSSEINAFALFGGNVVLYTGLIEETKTESELASVLAHEISHITQRHLARAMENRKLSNPITIAAAVGSVLLGLINPAAGVGALSSTIAGTQQNLISFTQANEQEADRIGIRVLADAGFNPSDMANFMQTLADKTRFSTTPPEILLTHPLPVSRISESRQRAALVGKATIFKSSLDYYLAKARVASYDKRSKALQLLIEQYGKSNDPQQKEAAEYAKALQDYDNKSYTAANSLVNKLLKQSPANEWYIDLATDIDIKRGLLTFAINRLKSALSQNNGSTILMLNLANSYIENSQYADAASLLHRYTHQYPNDINGWDLLATSYAKQQKRAEELAARAEIAALKGDFREALSRLNDASKQYNVNKTNQARYDSRIEQLKKLQQRFSMYE